MLLGKGNAKEAEKEAFYRETEPAFLTLVQNVIDGAVAELGLQWIKALRSQALVQFDRLAMPGLDQRSVRDIQAIVAARDHLGLTLSGHRDSSRGIFNALGLPLPSSVKRQGKAA
jgi:CRISPR system Cascade subunit CasA